MNPYSGSLFFIFFLKNSIKMYKIILLFLCILTVSCTQKKNPCKQGKPESLFSSKTLGISNHSFVIEGQNSTEKLLLDSIFPTSKVEDGKRLYIPIELTILQTGCEEITQEIRLEFFDSISPMPKDYLAQECAELVAKLFNELSTMDLNAIAFAELGKAISMNIDQFEYGTAVEIGSGFCLQIDKIHSSKSTLLTVIFKKV